MSHIFAIANQKGGVGKTTTSINLAASLANYGRKVLLVDMDSQGNATMGSGVDKRNLAHSVYDVLTGEADVLTSRVRCEEAQYDLLPANGDLVSAEMELMDIPGKEQKLRQALDKVRNNYHCIIIDCPPALSLLTINALVACDGVIIPMQCEYFALEGLSALVETIGKIRRTLNPRLQVEGIVRTMYDPRNSLTSEVTAQLHSHFGDRVYRIAIPRNVRLAEAPSYGKPAICYDRHSKGAIAYLGLAGEMIRRARAELEKAEQIA